MGVYDNDFTTFVPCLVDTPSAPGSRYLFDSLMAPAADDPYTVYPRLARNIEVGPNCDWVAFNLDYRARWNKPGASGCEETSSRSAESQDARLPVTADDVAYSFQAIKSHCSQGAKGLLNGVTGVQTPSNQKVVFKLKPDSCRSSIFTLAKLPIFSKKFFSDPAHDFTSKKPESMGNVVGSGPYMVAAANKNTIAYQRVCDYWGRDLPVSRGQYNFDRIQYLRFKDTDMLRAAFKIGEIDYLEDIPPQIKMSDDRKLKELAESGAISEHVVKYYGVESFEALTINTDKPALSDPRVRQALALLYEPEFVSQNLRSGESHGVHTYFPGADTSSAADAEVQSVLKDLKANYPNESLKPLSTSGKSRKRNPRISTLCSARGRKPPIA